MTGVFEGGALPRNCSRICWMSGVAPAILGGLGQGIVPGTRAVQVLIRGR